MKKFIIALLVLIPLSLNAQWEILNEGFRGQINTIDFVNEDVGWIAGSNGTLLKTTDGGENWATVHINESWNINQIDFINESVGWAIGSKHDSTGGYAIIIKSSDGGSNWLLQKQILGERLNSLCVIDENNAFTVGGNKIYKTTNGGTNWINVSINPTNRNYNSVWFQDSQTGAVVGAFNDGIKDRGFILKTTNGGSTWNQTTINEFNNIYDLQFIDSTFGYFKANNDTITFLCKTEDIFEHWEVRAQSQFGIGSYHYIDSSIVYANIADSITYDNIMKSTDGGVNWYSLESFQTYINRIYFIKINTGFIISSTCGGSILFRSSDSGDNWIVKKFSFPFKNTCFINKELGFMVGGGSWDMGHKGCSVGLIFSTQDGGKTWILKYGTGYFFPSCFIVNNSIVFSAGGSKIIKTSDAGNSWSTVYQNNPDSVGYYFYGFDISFLNEGIGWVVGNYSVTDTSGAAILGSADGGERWNLVWKYPNRNDFNYNLYSISSSDTTCWAVGGSGLIVKYTPQNGWIKEDSITDLPLNKVFCYGDNVWITGGYSNEQNRVTILLRSTNRGENWIKISNIPYLIYDIDFINQNLGWAIGYDSSGIGGILKSTNGGDSWEVSVGNLNEWLNSLTIQDNYGWAVGGNGLILRTTNAGITWVNEGNGKIYPTEFGLEQNYPNPFNPTTKINYSIPSSVKGETSKVMLRVYDVLGREVATLVSQEKDAGVYEVEFNPVSGNRNLVSGIYFYQLRAGSYVQTRKMILLK